MTDKLRAIRIASAKREIAYYEARITTAPTEWQRLEMLDGLTRENWRLARLEGEAA